MEEKSVKEVLEKNRGRIRSCPLFQQLKEEQLEPALRFFHAELRHFFRGEHLKQPGDVLSFFGLVLSGNVEVSLDDLDGNHLVMAYVAEGETFGESLCYLGRPNSVGIEAVSDCELLAMDCRNLTAPAAAMSSEEQKYLIRFTSLLAERTLLMNNRIQTLSRLTIREKLNAFFLQQELAAKGKVFDIAMDREHLAAYLGVNRSALSRELSRMKEEGLIDYYRSSFRIL